MYRKGIVFLGLNENENLLSSLLSFLVGVKTFDIVYYPLISQGESMAALIGFGAAVIAFCLIRFCCSFFIPLLKLRKEIKNNS